MKNNAIETIKERYSVRNYLDKPFEKEQIQKIQEFFSECKTGPFGNEVRFEIVDLSEMEKNEIKSLGTYGMISGGKVYIAGIVKRTQSNMEDLGYCMEKLILFLTQIGIGTCWMGGTFNRSNFAKKIHLEKNEILPAITPIGFIAEKKTFKENIIRSMVGAKKRKPHQEIFFEGSVNNPLDFTQVGKYREVLESVRLAPSASNKQPWCLIKDKDGNYNLYLNENTVYNNTIPEIKIQNIDMGIAMCHFELSANELSIKGEWIKEEPKIDCGKLKYIATWTERN